jgi:ferric-dicitrate binding protein FerR (iron transport regulator)
MKMNNKDIARHAASYLAGEMSRKESNSFLSSLEKDLEMKREFERMKDTWEKTDKDPRKDFKESNSAWNKLYDRLEEDGMIPDERPPVRLISPTAMKIAASILFLIAISLPSLLFLNKGGGNPEGMNYVAVSNNAAYDLPDGSRVFLKKGSELEISPSFEHERNVNLRGEAFFDIMADPTRPFSINTESANIVVLGTSFSVKELRPKGITEVYVESGKVSVQPSRADNKIVLSAGQFSEVDTQEARRSTLKDLNYLSWKTREFVFNNEKMENVFKSLEEAYQVTIIAKEDRIYNMRLTSTYQGQSIDAILETIATAFSLELEKNKEKYTLKQP